MAMKGWLKPRDDREETEESFSLTSNPEPRIPCALVLDISASMKGDPIEEVNRGLEEFDEALKSDPLAIERVEIAIVTFGPVSVVQDFVLMRDFTRPSLSASGNSPGCEALLTAGGLITNRRKLYKQHEVDSFSPFVLFMTDGLLTDKPLVSDAKAMVRQFEQSPSKSDRAAFFLLGTKGADMATLTEIAIRKPMPIQVANFRSMFRWVAASMQAISRSVVGDEIQLPPADWMKM